QHTRVTQHPLPTMVGVQGLPTRGDGVQDRVKQSKVLNTCWGCCHPCIAILRPLGTSVSRRKWKPRRGGPAKQSSPWRRRRPVASRMHGPPPPVTRNVFPARV